MGEGEECPALRSGTIVRRLWTGVAGCEAESRDLIESEGQGEFAEGVRTALRLWILKHLCCYVICSGCSSMGWIEGVSGTRLSEPSAMDSVSSTVSISEALGVCEMRLSSMLASGE